MAKESMNLSEEPSRSCGEKRPSTESESELSKKARGSGDGGGRLASKVKKVAEILLLLATMVEMRGGRKVSSVEVEMMIEARRKLVEICEEFCPKDVFENDVFGRMKETKLAACCPKMSICEKLEVTKVKMEEDEFYLPTEPRSASNGVHPTMAHASRVSDSVNSPFELPTSEVRRGGSNASTNRQLGKHSTVHHHINLVQDPTHEEIAKIVQNIVNAHTPKPDHKTWTVPSTNDCMNKVLLTCQTCECVINEMYGAVLCDACESACHLRCVQLKSEPISGEDWYCLKCVENRNGKPFPPKYGRVVKNARKPEMPSSTAAVQLSIEKKIQPSDGNNNQKKMSSETCTVVNENEGSVSSSMRDVEWVGDKLNEVDGKTYYRSCCINGTTYQLQHYALFFIKAHDALFSSTGKNHVPGKLQDMWEDSKTNKKWVTVRRCFFPDDVPESVGRPCAPESYEVYESNYQLTLPAGSIHGPCEVLPPKKCSNERAMQSRAQTTAGDKPKPLFLCKWFYA